MTLKVQHAGDNKIAQYYGNGWSILGGGRRIQGACVSDDDEWTAAIKTQCQYLHSICGSFGLIGDISDRQYVSIL